MRTRMAVGILSVVVLGQALPAQACPFHDFYGAFQEDGAGPQSDLPPQAAPQRYSRFQFEAPAQPVQNQASPKPPAPPAPLAPQAPKDPAKANPDAIEAKDPALEAAKGAEKATPNP